MGTVILVATVLAFLALAAWVVLVGTKPIIPDGIAKTVQYRGHKVVVVFSPRITSIPAQAAEKCAHAVWATGEAWKKQKREDVSSELKHVVVHYVTDEEFAYSEASSYLGYAVRRFGEDLPKAVIRSKHLGLTVTRGEPVIHEMIHAIFKEYTREGFDRDHTNHTVWSGATGDTPIELRVQYVAGRMFRELS